MKHTIELSEWTEMKLAERAAREGKTKEALAVEIIEEALERADVLDEIIGKSIKPFIVTNR